MMQPDDPEAIALYTRLWDTFSARDHAFRLVAADAYLELARRRRRAVPALARQACARIVDTFGTDDEPAMQQRVDAARRLVDELQR